MRNFTPEPVEQCPESCPWCETYGTHDPELIAADDARQAEHIADEARSLPSWA